MRKWFKEQWDDIKGHAKWDLIKYAVVFFGASGLALAAVLWQALRHAAIDKYLFGILFLLSAGMFFALVRKISSPYLSAKRTGPTPIESEPPKPKAEAKTNTVLDGELHRVFICPRMGIPYKMLQEIWQLTKHSDEPQVDCDILVAMYVVNVSASNQYIREVTASVEVEGERKDMQRQDDFRLRFRDEESDDLEYGFEVEDHDEPISLTPLLPQLPCELPPNKPLEGWVRFILPSVAPGKVDSNTWQFAVVDSLGNQHFITKTSNKPKKGEIGFRRRR
jgi:hypothetical protein